MPDAPDPVRCYWSREGLLRALENLLGNAIKYGARDNGDGERSRAGACRADRGPQRGLAIVKNITESHGGTVALDSRRDPGTTFFLNLPLDARPFFSKSPGRAFESLG